MTSLEESIISSISQMGNPAKNVSCSSLQLVEELGFDLRSAGPTAFRYTASWAFQCGPTWAKTVRVGAMGRGVVGDSMALWFGRLTASLSVMTPCGD